MLKKFRVLTRNPIMGHLGGETFEAKWPDKVLARRIAANQLEMVKEPKKKAPEPQEPIKEEKEA